MLTAIKTRQSIRKFTSRPVEEDMVTAMLESAAGAIVICGDKNVEGIKEFLYADCAAAAQNIMLGVHGLGLGGVWCGVVSNSDWRKLMIAALGLLSWSLLQ